jgi:hypothetical protein
MAVNLITTTAAGTPAGFDLMHMDVRGACATINGHFEFPHQNYRMMSDELPAGLHFCRVHGGHMQVIERRADGDWSGFTHNFPLRWFA